MPTSQPARKRLPVKPSDENLRKQAKRLSKSIGIPLQEAQHQLAREYGCVNWTELLNVVEVMNRGADQLANVKRKVEPLPSAVRQRDVALVRQILASGEFTNHDLDAALAHAAWYGGDAPDVLKVRRELFDLLLEHGADPDGQYGSAYGPIVFGTGECLSPDGLQWLIDAGADVTFSPVDTKYGRQCPMSYWLGAYARGSNDLKHRGIEILLKHNAFIPTEVTPPMLAIHRGDAKTLADLLDSEPALVHRRFRDMPYGNIPLAGATLLHCAVEFDEIECCGVLLDRQADINARADVIDGIGGQTPIFHTINTFWKNKLTTLEYLLSKAGSKIDMSIRATFNTYEGPHVKPVTPIEYAEEPGGSAGRANAESEIMLLRGLLAQSSDAELSPIHLAAKEGNCASVRELIAAGADVNATSKNGNTPLWLACQSAAAASDRIVVARLLIDAGAHVRKGCENRSTALHVAASRGPVEMVELLLRSGVKEWQPDKDSKIALDYARDGIASDKEQIVELLTRPVMRDRVFRAAVQAIHAGDLAALESMLADRTSLSRERAIEPDCYPKSYFSDPKLLWFVANNPTLIKQMPANLPDIARAIINCGVEQEDLDYTLALVMTSSPAHDQNLQRPLMIALLEAGANADDLTAALGHRELDPVRFLLERGHPITLDIAASFGMTDAMLHLIDIATPQQRQQAFGLAVINHQIEAVRMCLEAGVDVNLPLPVHSHSRPVHQAAVDDNVPMLELLINNGARLDVADTLWNGTPLGWAQHMGKTAAAVYIEAVLQKDS